MSSDVLEIVILGKDQASKVFDSVGSAMGTAFKVGTGLAIAGLGGLTAALGLSISEAMDAQEIQAELNAVLKSTKFAAGLSADALNKMASELANVTKFSDDQITSAQTLLLTFTKIGKEVFPEATEAVLNMAEIFGSADQAAIQLGKALNDPIAGVGALRRVGVSFTKEQEELIKKMVESGDVMGAQKLILKELETEFGGVARAAGNTLSGKLVILKNKLLDVAEGVGMKLLPPLIKVVDTLIDKGVPAVENFITAMEPFVSSVIWPIQQFVENLQKGMSPLEAFKQALSDVILVFEWLLTQFGVTAEDADKITDVIRKLALDGFDFLTEKVAPFVKEHLPALKNAFIAVAAVLAGAAIVSGILSIVAAIGALFNPITLLIGAVALLAIAWTEDWGGIRTYIVETVWPAVKPVLQQLVDWLEINIPKAVLFLRTMWETVLIPTFEKLKTFWFETVKPALVQLVDWFMTYIPMGINVLKGFWENTLMPLFYDIKAYWDEHLRPLFEALAEYLNQKIPEAIDAAKPFFNDLKEAAKDLWTWLGNLETRLRGVFSDAINSVNPLLNDFTSLIDNVTSALNRLTGRKDEVRGPTITVNNPGIGALVQSRLGPQAPQPGQILYNDGIWRDHGGRGRAGQLYKIGVPELFIPDTAGTFAPLTEGKAVAATIQELDSSVRALVAAVREMGSSKHNNDQYNLHVYTNSQQERVQSDFELMKTWAGA